MLTAIATCTANASAAPIQTASGRPRDARMSDANIVLSGSSPKKISGKTARTMPSCTGGFYPTRAPAPERRMLSACSSRMQGRDE